MSCKICNPPAPGMCSRCEAEVKVQVLETTDRIWNRMAGISRAVAGDKLIKEERTVNRNATPTLSYYLSPRPTSTSISEAFEKKHHFSFYIPDILGCGSL